MDQVVELLQELATTGKSMQIAVDAEDAAVQLNSLRAITLDQPRLAAVRKISRHPKGKELWEQLACLSVSLSDATRALSGLMSMAGQQQALLAAVFHSHLLLIDGCPVFSMFDRSVCGACLKLLRDFAGSKRTAAGKKDRHAKDADAMDIDGAANGTDGEAQDPSQHSMGQRPLQGGPLIAEVLQNLAALLERFGLRDQPDTVRNFAEAAAEISRSLVASEAAEACFALLAQLMQPMHGSVREVAAMVFRLLTNNILGLGEAGGKVPAGNTAKQAAATRGRAIQFAKDCLRCAPESRDAVAALARHVLLKAPDKAEFRASAVDGAVALALVLDSAEQQQLVAFVARLSRTPKVSQRQMAVELAPALLEAFDSPFAPVDLPQPPTTTATEGATGTSSKTPANQKLVVDGKELMAAPWGAVCLAVLVQRCADKSAVVRGRAMQHLAGVVASWTSFNGGNSREEVRFCAALSLAHEVKLQPQELLGRTPGLISPSLVSPAAADEPGGTPMTVDENTPHPRRDGSATTSKPSLTRTYSCFTMPALLEGGEADLHSLLHLARKRCSDEKGQVRKAAVQLLEALLIMRAAGVQRILPQPKEVAALEAASGDVLVSVRKAGLTAVHSLLKALPDQPAVAELWVRAALPLVRDVEASIQETLLDQFQDLVTSRAVAAGAVSKEGAPTSSAHKAAEELRPILAAFTTGGGACKACVARACSQLKAKSRLKTKQGAAGLQQIILGLGASSTAAVPEGSMGLGTLNADAAAGAWLLFAEVSACDPGAPSWRFLQEQWDLLTQQANGAAPGAGAASDNAAQLLKVIAAAAAEFPPNQATQLSNQLLRALRGFSLAPSAAAAHVSAVAQLTRQHGKGAMGWVPELLSGAEKLLGGYVDSYQVGRSQAAMVGEDWQAAGALFTVGELALLRSCKPSSRLVVLVQALTASRLALAPATASQQASQGEGVDAVGACVDVPGTVQAHSWVALGKLCLTDEALAKKCVPLFVQELGRAQQPAVRNNIMVALADLVINYTALVDSHIPRLAACIRDPNELVRTQALALLANLLQKDYVKWRGPLFHRFVLALIDDSPRVCALAEYLLGDTIATKMPNLAYNHFVEALFVLNDCQVGLHGGAAAAAAVSEGAGGHGGVADREAFCLQGSSPGIRAKRGTIYRALLSRMSPEHKFATAARLCQEVLGGAADGALPLEECQEVLGDALRILACKEIKVTASRAAAEDLELDPAAAVGAAKGKLVSAMMKKHLVEGVVPVIIELKRGMEAARHPLLGELMAATAAMLKDYKHEIEDILVADKQLAKEILYDIRQAEQAKQAAKSALPQQAEGQGARTPVTAGGLTRQDSLPAGTTCGTPMAAEVLLTARKASGGSGGRTTPASGAVMPTRTPGGGRLPSKTPSSGFKTPRGAVAAVEATRGQGAAGATASRLARASGPLPSPQPPSAGDGPDASPMSVPRLRPGRPALVGGSRLRPREHAELARETAALAVAAHPGEGPSKGGGCGDAAAKGREEGEHVQAEVVLPFAAPPSAVGNGREPQWNVNPEAAQLAQHGQAPCGSADTAERAVHEDAAGTAPAAGAPSSGPGRTQRGRTRLQNGGKGGAENSAPPVNSSVGAGGKDALQGLLQEGSKSIEKGLRRTSRKRKA